MWLPFFWAHVHAFWQFLSKVIGSFTKCYYFHCCHSNNSWDSYIINHKHIIKEFEYTCHLTPSIWYFTDSVKSYGLIYEISLILLLVAMVTVIEILTTLTINTFLKNLTILVIWHQAYAISVSQSKVIGLFTKFYLFYCWLPWQRVWRPYPPLRKKTTSRSWLLGFWTIKKTSRQIVPKGGEGGSTWALGLHY